MMAAETSDGRRFCVTVAVDRYQHLSEADQLARPSADAELFAGNLLSAGYERPITGMGNYWPADQIRSALSQWARDARFQPDDAVVFYFAGHGLVEDRDRHYLLCSNSDPDDPGTALPTEDLVRTFIRNGLRNLLVVLDVCYAGAGAADGAQYVLRSVARQAGNHEGGGVWFLSAARAKDEAADGVFVRALLSGIADAQERTGQRQRFLDLVDVVDAVNRHLQVLDATQRAELAAGMVTGLPPFLDNGGYRPDLPHGDTDLELQRLLADRELLDHFGPRSRGVEFDSEPGLYFSGRERALRELVDWLTAEKSDGKGRVVTGSPGCGKSAVLGRIVALSDPGYRNKLLAEHEPLAIPVPEGLVNVAVHARHKGLPEIVQHVAAGLNVTAEGTGHLLRELSLRARQGQPIVIVVDALDEAGSGTASDAEGRGEPRRIARELLRPMSEISGVRLLVGARRELMGPLGASMRVLDLDDGYLGPRDVAGYVTKVLLAYNEPDVPTPYRDKPDIAAMVGNAVADRAAGVFLVARMTARSLRTLQSVMDTTLPGWQDELPAEIGEAFEDYLKWFGTDEHRVRILLTPLAFAEGQGLPRGVLWTKIAEELSGRTFGEHDIDWLLDQAGAYIAEVTDRGRSVYRLYHQALAEHLRKTCRIGQSAAQEKIVGALLAATSQTADGAPDWLSAQPYVRSHLATHAGAAGQLDQLLQDPGFLLAAEQLVLLRALPRAVSESARKIRAAYEQVAHQLVDSTPLGERASYLQFSARRCDADSFAQQIDQLGIPLPWRTRWSWWSATGVHRQLIGHQKTVWAVAAGDLDGRPVALTGSADGTARVWDLTTQRPLGDPWRPGSKEITAVALGELDEYSIGVTGGSDGRLQIWDLSSGQAMGAALVGHTNKITSIAVGELDGETIAVSGSRDGTTRVWNLNDQTAIGDPIAGHRSSVNSVALGVLDGRQVILSAGNDKRVWVWDLETHEINGKPLIGHTQRVTAVACGHLDGRAIAVTASKDRQIGLWDLQTRQQLGEPIEGFYFGVNDVAIGQVHDQPVVIACGRMIAAAWNLRTRQPIGQPLTGHDGNVSSVAFGVIERNPVALTTGDDSTTRIWDLRAERPPNGHTGMVRSAAIGRVDGRSVGLTGSTDTTIVVWDLDANGVQDGLPLAGHRATVSTITVGTLRDRAIAVTGDEDAVVKVWDLGHRVCLATLPTRHNGQITDLSLSELDGVPVLATGSQDGTIRIWNLMTREELCAPFNGHSADIDMVMFCDVGGRTKVLGATDRGELTVWDMATRQPTTHGDSTFWQTWGVRALGVVDGKPIALLGAWNNSLVQWDPITGTVVGDTMVGHTNRILQAVIGSAAGQPVAITGSDDGTVRLWDLRTSRPVGSPLPGHSAEIRAVAIGAGDDSVAISATADDEVRLWSLKTFHQVGDMLTGKQSSVFGVTVVQQESDARVIAVGGDGAVRVRRLSDGRLAGPLLNGHRHIVWSAAATVLDGEIAVSAGWDRAVRIWDLDTYRERFKLAHTEWIRAVAVAVRNSSPVIAAGAGPLLVVWDLVTRSVLAELPGHTGEITAIQVAVMDDTTTLITGSTDSTARLWNLDTLQPTGSPLAGHDRMVNAVDLELIDDQMIAYTGDDGGVVRAWNQATGEQLRLDIPAADRWITGLKHTRLHGRRILAVASSDGVLRLYCLDTATTLARINVSTSIGSLAFTEDGALCLGTGMGMVVFEIQDWANL